MIFFDFLIEKKLRKKSTFNFLIFKIFQVLFSSFFLLENQKIHTREARRVEHHIQRRENKIWVYCLMITNFIAQYRRPKPRIAEYTSVSPFDD